MLVSINPGIVTLTRTWSYQEDIYNVDEFASMITGWEARVRELGGDPGGSVEAARAGLS